MCGWADTAVVGGGGWGCSPVEFRGEVHKCQEGGGLLQDDILQSVHDGDLGSWEERQGGRGGGSIAGGVAS